MAKTDIDRSLKPKSEEKKLKLIIEVDLRCKNQNNVGSFVNTSHK